MPEPKVVINSADLIAKAKITKIKGAMKVPYLREKPDQDITFEILDIYKGDEELLGNEITANFSSFMMMWGPTLAEEQEGEFLFIYNEKDEFWDYFGPGGCTYLNEDVWQALKAGEHTSP